MYKRLERVERHVSVRLVLSSGCEGISKLTIFLLYSLLPDIFYTPLFLRHLYGLARYYILILHTHLIRYLFHLVFVIFRSFNIGSTPSRLGQLLPRRYTSCKSFSSRSNYPLVSILPQHPIHANLSWSSRRNRDERQGMS